MWFYIFTKKQNTYNNDESNIINGSNETKDKLPEADEMAIISVKLYPYRSAPSINEVEAKYLISANSVKIKSAIKTEYIIPAKGLKIKYKMI